MRDSSPNAHACRSRRGEVPEGSPFFSPDVEGRSPEDSGLPAICLIYTTPSGCRTPRASLIVRHPCGVVEHFFHRDIPGSSSGHAPLLDTRAIYANHQTFGVEILCGLILLSYFEVVVGII